jgi:hypothetical protein
MDDLILTGTVSLIGLYTAAILIAAGVIFVLLQVWQAAVEGNTGRVAVILAGGLIILAAYAGTGLWLQKSGRI